MTLLTCWSLCLYADVKEHDVCRGSSLKIWQRRNRQKPARAWRGSCSGDPSAVEPPVPIPNTEVKRCSPDGSASIGCARVGRCQNPPSPWFSMGRVFLFSGKSFPRRGHSEPVAVTFAYGCVADSAPSPSRPPLYERQGSRPLTWRWAPTSRRSRGEDPWCRSG